MALSSRAADRWSRHTYLMMWYYSCVSFSCRFYGELTKTVNIAGELLPHTPHQHNPATRSWTFSMKFWSWLHACRLISFFDGFHGNRKMTMPTEVRFPDNNEAKHIKLVLVGHFCPGSSHLKVCVWLKVQRKMGGYFARVVHIRITWRMNLENMQL